MNTSGAESSYRSGFVCFVGRPNVGKSTLTNALVGEKVAITSSRPQTTRRTIRGIVSRPDAQLILVDTPGLHRPRTLLGERLNALVHDAIAEVDVIGFCVPADAEIGAGDRFLATQLASARTPVVAIVTKTDTVRRDAVGAKLLAVQQLGVDVGIDFAHLVPVSATAGEQVGVLADVLVSLLPEGPALYPDDEITDEPEKITIAELIREAALEGVREEMPHSLAVVVEDMGPRKGRPEDKPLLDVFAHIFVERPSQKSIIIGAKGARLRDVGSTARRAIEERYGMPVYLDLHVKVAKDWQRDPKQLHRLGF